jgi:hypothetical protein
MESPAREVRTEIWRFFIDHLAWYFNLVSNPQLGFDHVYGACVIVIHGGFIWGEGVERHGRE